MASAATASRRAGSSHARRRGRSTRGPIRWQRVGRLALLGTLAVIVLLYVPPLTHWVQQHSTAAHSRAELSQLQAEHSRLRSRLDALSSSTGIEQAARGLGMVRRGERAYVIEPAASR